MDSRRFDDLTRALSTAPTRRRFVQSLAVGITGMVGLRSTRVLAAATCYGKDDTCDGDGDCCSGSCDNGACTCVGSGSVCYSGEDCCNGLRCASGIRQDGDACIPCGEGAECGSDDDCCNDLVCVEGSCAAAEGPTCGEADAVCTLDEDCCEGFYCVGVACVEIPTCAPLYCSGRVTCCDNKICLDSGGNLPTDDNFSGGSCYVRTGQLCDENGDQGCQVGECIDGYCGGPPACLQGFDVCTTDDDCCGDLVCTDGTCSDAPPVDTGGNGDGDGGEETGGGSEEPAMTLPQTGTGGDEPKANAPAILAGAAAATALIAAKRLRAKPDV